MRIIGRLDKDTSGVVILAKNQAAGARLGEQKAKGIFRKEYIGLAQGHLKEPEGRIREPIGKMPGEKLKMQVTPEGKSADTSYQALKFLENATLARWKIFTGRTHQIRVHMAWLGHPLLGDPIYGTGENPYFPGLALHCAKAVFLQPFTGEKVVIQAPPEGWNEKLKEWVLQNMGSELKGTGQEFLL